MAIIKCKMCGGDLRLEEGSTVCECEYCGTRQTVPSADNEKKLTLFSRAGRLLRGCEFDKAAGVFETIIADFPEEAEAYWGLVLCKYGIEYVDDPATGKKIPTCHRSSFDSVLDDPNYEQACENTDAIARRVYRDEARQIEDLRKRIIEVSGKEEPYDVFISYKETDEHGDRTLDSVIAQDIYTELIEKGYRVFFSRISLEDKLGTEYEPYIFAALNSAKVMLVVGTDYENFDAVWVKNEWSRFLKLIASGQKKTLIPVFKNMDAYDMPKEFAKLAAQDMGKVGAMQDLVRGVEKLLGKKNEAAPAPQPQQVIVQQSGGPNVGALLTRGRQALEDGDWEKATGFYDQVLSMDAENAEAFFGLFLTGAKCSNEEQYIQTACSQEAAVETLSITPDTERAEAAVRQYTIKGYLSENEIRALFQYDLNYPSTLKAWRAAAARAENLFKSDRNLVRAVRYSKGDAASRPIRFKTALSAALEKAVKEAEKQEKVAEENKRQEYAAFLDSAEKKAQERHQTAQERQEAAYQDAMQRFEQAKNVTDFQSVRKCFLLLLPYKDSAQMITRCDEKLAQIMQADAEEAERQRVAKEKAEKASQAKKKRLRIVAVLAVVLAFTGYFTYTKVIVPGRQYAAAEALYEAGQYEQAIAAFKALGDYKDSAGRIEDIREAIRARDYAAAEALYEAGQYGQAYAEFIKLKGYKDVDSLIEKYEHLIKLAFTTIGNTVRLGTYEQDNNTANGKEAIEWVVLATEGDRSLLISKYALDCQQYYNEEYTSVTWETSTLRKWLNDTFLHAAFSAEERAIISIVTVSADKNPIYGTSPGNSTQDQIFLLSIQEVKLYFSSDEARRCVPTAYAIAQGAYINDNYSDGGKATCWWWLRSPGFDSRNAARVARVGSVDASGNVVGNVRGAVRPAMWIELGDKTRSK